MTPALGSIVANRFELIREIGRGGMGTVWLAEHLTLGVRCAVKFVNTEAMDNPDFAASYIARFELEARAIARLGSTNVVRILDYDSHEGVPFIAMECLQGEDLAARLARVKRLDPATTYRIVSQVANGLAKAHAAGIIHRDLKPENIFLAQDDSGEVAKLLDFGVAKLTGMGAPDSAASSTYAGTLVGTPFYMSPEQARSLDEVDHRADLWSLAVIAFECLLGRLPFQSAALGDLFAKIIFEPLPVPSQMDANCTDEFDRWWARAAARDAHERFSSAPEMAEALGRALGIVEPSTEALATWEPGDPKVNRTARAFARRPRFLVAAVVVVFAPLAATLCSGAIDARSATGATSMSAASLARSVAPIHAPAPAAAHAEAAVANASSEPPAGPELPDTAVSMAAASRGSAERASLRSKASSPRRAPRASPSSSDDVDFGI